MSRLAHYKVVGQREVLGHAPGEEFDARLDPVMEVRLIAGGHIEKIKQHQKKKTDDVQEDEKE